MRANAGITDQTGQRRWFQFRIRSLLILTLIVAATMAFWVRPAMLQRAVVRTLPADATVGYDFQTAGGGASLTPAYVPGRLVDLLGIDFFADVTSVQVIVMSENVYPHLGQLHNIEWLDIRDRNISPAHLANLTPLTRLRGIRLRGASFQNSAIVHLSHFNTVQSLDLTFAEVGDGALEYVNQLRDLRTLRLGGTRITDAGLIHLQKLRNLEHLELFETQITDAGLAALRDIPELQSLRLGATQITDASIDHMIAMRKLAAVELYDTKITPAGIARLEAERPDCNLALVRLAYECD